MPLTIFWHPSLASVPAIPALKWGEQTSAHFSKCECVIDLCGGIYNIFGIVLYPIQPNIFFFNFFFILMASVRGADVFIELSAVTPRSFS